MVNLYPLVGDIKFDDIKLTYDGANNLIQVDFLQGGSLGVIVTTLILTYDGASNLIEVLKSPLT